MYLVYYNIIMKCFSMCSMKKLGLSNYFKIGLTWFRLVNSNNTFCNKLLYNNKFYNKLNKKKFYNKFL